MKITEVNIPADYPYTNGLKDILLKKLPYIVLVAGKNGSGKTRFLNKLKDLISEKPIKSDISIARIELQKSKDIIIEIELEIQVLKNYKNNRSYNNKTAVALENEILNLNDQLEKWNKVKLFWEERLNWKYVSTDRYTDSYYQILDFSPKINDNKDYNLLISIEINRYSKVARIESNVNLISANETLFKEYYRFKKLVEELLETEIIFDNEKGALINGLPIEGSNLSEGQKVLLFLCLNIAKNENSLGELIIMMDEPENHLHPSIILKIIDLIHERNKEGQIWIATHSLNILAHFDPSSIFYVEAGEVTFSGNIPQRVLKGLLGSDIEIEKLIDFIGLPSQHAMINFAYQCLFHPLAIETLPDDPQTSYIKEYLKRHNLNGTNKIRILDFGAGKGRLLSNISESLKKEGILFQNRFDYIAYDSYDFDKKACLECIKKYYNDLLEARYFNSYHDILAFHDKNSFDFVIMCNVLHEIDPLQWLNLFKKGGEISSLLKEDGYLFLLEDLQMPIGEKAYQKGFIVFDTAQLKELFQISSKDDFEFFDLRQDGRLKAHIISKQNLIKITAKSRLSSLRSLNNLAQEKIKAIRLLDKTYSNGRKQAFWLQQFANTQLAISELS